MRENIRNIAIIAHVDHGKTTLVDQMLRQSGTFRDNEIAPERAMDSGDLEREKGITILAKNTSIIYQNHRINIVDTPGHADFGGEVERIMRMVDGVLLVVDAFEGCMPQTRFVLKKALEAGLTPIVVINKMDRSFVRPAEVVDEVIDLFIDLDAEEEQLEFPVLYASGIQGIASKEPILDGDSMRPLLDTIIDTIPSPKGDADAPFQMQTTLMDYNDFVGKIAIGTIRRGRICVGDSVQILDRSGKSRQHRITKLYSFSGLQKVEISEAEAGDIVAIAGLGDCEIGETICAIGHLDPLPFIEIEPPTLEMIFLVNDSPFAGKDGEPVTSRKLLRRLEREQESDIALRISETDSADQFRVAGRGELHLSILVEKMRREGIEFQVSMPRVIIREENGEKLEPYELVTLDLPEEYVGTIIQRLSQRYGELLNMQTRDGRTRLEYKIPSRGLVGFRSDFLTETHGYGLMHSILHGYDKWAGPLQGRHTGALIVHETGSTTAYGLKSAEDRGTLFIQAGIEVYEGMVIGESNREQDITVNVCKGKKLTNTRAAGKDDAIQLRNVRELSLEEALSFLAQDEYLEVTPHYLRLRKRFLKEQDRARYRKQQIQ